MVEKVSGENISVEAVKNILKVTKASRKKLERVNLNVSLKGIAVNDLQGTEVFKVSIYRYVLSEKLSPAAGQGLFNNNSK